MEQKIERVDLCKGVSGCKISDGRFKTTTATVTFFLPLSKDTVCANSVLPYLLTGANAKYPDARSISVQLDKLYGASLIVETGKLGDLQSLNIGITFVDNRFVNCNSLLSDCARFLRDLIFDPKLENGVFADDLFKKEKRLLIERIEGEINDKRCFARSRCEAVLCEGEPYGLPVQGTKEQAEGLTSKEATDAWHRMLSTAQVRISVASGQDCSEIFDVLSKAFERIDRNPSSLPAVTVKAASDKVKTVTDKMNVTQGKLVMGLRTGEQSDGRDVPKYMVFCDLFGGSPNSKLFVNVREKLSLCYYCAARINRRKGIMLVDSGVEFDNAEKAKEEILRQLESVQKGEFSDDDIAAARLSVSGSARSVNDSQGALIRWYGVREFDKYVLSPEEFAKAAEKITREQIIEAAKSFKLDTVYTLLGEDK